MEKEDGGLNQGSHNNNVNREINLRYFWRANQQDRKETDSMVIGKVYMEVGLRVYNGKDTVGKILAGVVRKQEDLSGRLWL